MPTTINSLPTEIIFLILEFAGSPRSELLIKLTGIHTYEDLQLARELFIESNSVLCDFALVCKSWTHSAQTLLLQSVILNADESIPHLLNAPFSQFQVNHLHLMLPPQPETANPQVRNLLSKLNGLKSLQLRNNFTDGVEQVLDVSMFLTPGLSKLQSLTLSNLSIRDENNGTSTIPTFKLKELVIGDVDISDSAAKYLVTPALTKLSLTQLEGSELDFVNVLKLAAPHLEFLHMDFFTDQDTTPYIPIIPLCKSVTEFSFFFDDSTPSFLSIISAFATNQLLHLKLLCYSTYDLPNLMMLLRQPSLQNLQSLTLIVDPFEPNSPEIAIPTEVPAECARRGVLYKYEILETIGAYREEEEEQEQV